MKITHLIFSLEVGGAENLLTDIANLQSINHKVSIIIVNNIYSTSLIKRISKNVEILTINRPEQSINPYYILKLNLTINKINPDVIHCHHHNLINLLFFRKKCKVYLTLHRNGIPLDNLRKYNKIFAISEDVKSNIRGSYNIISCPNGVLYDNIDIKVDYNFDTFKIIQIGRLQSKIKGQDILINAIHHLVYHLKFDNISLDIVGQGPDMKLLQKLIDDLSLNNYVKLVGNWDRDYLYQNLKNYSLLVQPSRDEGFGLTIAEGMFAKIPVLVSDIGGPMEVIGQGNFGFHFENTNFVDCANKIFNIKNTYLDLENTQKLSDAYNFALEKFSIQKTVENYLIHY